MKKAIFIYNPVSGNRRTLHKLDYIIGRFQANNILLQPYRLFSSQQEKLLDTLKHGDYDLAIASGGDGTLNLVVNIMLKNNINLPIGFIPTGTCNDFARSLDIPNDLNKCLDIILSGKTTKVDVGLINEQNYFLGTCAGGCFVGVSFNTHNELKKNFGPFAYYLKALSEVKNLKSFKLNIKTETEEIVEDEVLIFLVLNGKDAAGFSNLIKEADLSDGIMDIVLIKSCSHIDLASMFFKVLSSDSLNDRNVRNIRAKTCTIQSDSDVVLRIDGEKGSGLPVSIRFINKALTVFVK